MDLVYWGPGVPSPECCGYIFFFSVAFLKLQIEEGSPASMACSVLVTPVKLLTSVQMETVVSDQDPPLVHLRGFQSTSRFMVRLEPVCGLGLGLLVALQPRGCGCWIHRAWEHVLSLTAPVACQPLGCAAQGGLGTCTSLPKSSAWASGDGSRLCRWLLVWLWACFFISLPQGTLTAFCGMAQ